MVNVKSYKRNIKTRKFEEYILKDIDKEIRANKVTYRGLGMGKIASDFYKITKDTGFRIRYKKVEYIVTSSTLERLKKIGRIDFKAPYRRGMY